MLTNAVNGPNFGKLIISVKEDSNNKGRDIALLNASYEQDRYELYNKKRIKLFEQNREKYIEIRQKEKKVFVDPEEYIPNKSYTLEVLPIDKNDPKELDRAIRSEKSLKNFYETAGLHVKLIDSISDDIHKRIKEPLQNLRLKHAFREFELDRLKKLRLNITQ